MVYPPTPNCQLLSLCTYISHLSQHLQKGPELMLTVFQRNSRFAIPACFLPPSFLLLLGRPENPGDDHEKLQECCQPKSTHDADRAVSE
jgi:hypothetical protein